MRFLRAVLALVAAVAISQAVAGEPNRAFHVIKNPDNEPALDRSGAPDCNADVCDQLVRYKDKAIIEATEYLFYPDGTCKFEDEGVWSSPKDILPIAAGKVTFSTEPDTAPPNPYTGATCKGGGPYKYRRLHFKWTLARNDTGILGYGPTATFSSIWKGTHGNQFHDTFELSVPVVRPIGEKMTFKNFRVSHPPPNTAGAYGVWEMTLIPPQDPPENKDFDFTGESISESYANKKDDCAARAPGVLGSVATTPASKPASWPVGKLITDKGTTDAPKNVWGPDYTGLDACSIFAYRCAGATSGLFFNPLPCRLSLTQEIRIKSPADQDFTKDPIYTNTLGEGVGGEVHHYSLTYYLGVAGSGPVFAKRMPLTGSSEGGGEFQAEYPDSARDCASKPQVLGNLDVRYCLRPLVK